MARLSLVPGFRFNPTDEEVVMYFLKRKIMRKKIAIDAVAEVNIYDYHPSDLPDKSALKSGDLEWYFFCPKSKRYSTGSRAKRATETGFWKATGKDRFVEYRGRTVATIKTLVFHLGRAKDCERTNWVLHEYRMADAQLANAGVAQDTYVLCKLFEKSGAGPKNGAQYGAPFNEDEWDDDLVSSIDSQAIVGLVDASITRDRKQKGPATMHVTEPGSSIVTSSAMELTSTLNYKQKGPATTTNLTEPGSYSVLFSANEPANMLNHKQQGPATTSMAEPGLSSVTLSANEPTNTLNYKQKGPATTDMTEPGSSVVTSFANKPTSTLNYNQKDPATTNMTEPGSSTVMFYAHEPTNTLNYKQKGPATTNMIVPQTTCGLSVAEPGSSSFMNKTPSDDDLFDVNTFFADDTDIMTGVPEEAVHMEKFKAMTPSEDYGIFDGFYNITTLDDVITVNDLNTGLEYPIDEYRNLDGPDLGGFFVEDL